MKRKPRIKKKQARPKPKGGGGARSDNLPVALKLDSVAEIFLSGKIPENNSAAENTSQCPPPMEVGAMTEEQKRHAVESAKHDFERESARINTDFPQRSDDQIAIDRVLLALVGKRIDDICFKNELETVILALINEKKLFGLRHFQLVHTVIEHLCTIGQKVDENPLAKVMPSMDSQKLAQDELANIAALFIASKSISKSFAMPWLLAASKWEHFKAKWKYVRRQQKPHERVQFEFTYDTLAGFDAMVARLMQCDLAHVEWEFPKPRSSANDFITKLRWDNRVMADCLEAVLDRLEAALLKSKSRLGTPWGNAWADLRRSDPELCVDLITPYLEIEWQRFKSARKLVIAKKSWSLVQKRIRNCALTIYKEWPFPPIDPVAKAWLVPKHSH